MAAKIKSLLETQRGIMQAVSHELRTPLARMRFKLAFIDDALEEQGQQQTDPIRHDIVQVEQLIDEILEFHKLSQQPDLHLNLIDTQRLITTTQSNLAALYPTIQMQFEQDEGVKLVADERGMEKVLQNLCSNACKHATGVVRVSLKSAASGVTISVEDDGAGIPDEEKVRVFEAFYRSDSKVNQQQKGYGLGLSIVRRIVSLHHGRVSVRDSDLGGALFDVELPSEPVSQRQNDG